MRSFLLTVMMFCLCVVCGAQEPSINREFASQHGGKLYRFAVTAEMVEVSPAWVEENNDPPLSPRLAIKAALSQLLKLVTAAEKWSMNEVRLVPVRDDKWVYAVEFHRWTPGPPAGTEAVPVPPFTVIILMNGVAVEPKITQSEFP